jgi:hypothetical protein
MIVVVTGVSSFDFRLTAGWHVLRMREVVSDVPPGPGEAWPDSRFPDRKELQ